MKKNIINKIDLKKLFIPSRKFDTFKNKEWHTLIIWWSIWKTWAIILAAKSASKTGSWLVTAIVSKKLNSIFESNLIEEMTLPVQNDKKWMISFNWFKRLKSNLKQFNSILIWPWMWVSNWGMKILINLIKILKNIPLVIDADWINNLAKLNKLKLEELFKKKKTEIVLTPHIWEFKKLFWINEKEIKKNQNEITWKFSKKYNIYIVLKSHITTVWTPNWEVFISNIWTPALSTAWTWDVLSWIISSLIWKEYNQNNILNWILSWVIIHAITWKISWEEVWENYVIASDLINRIWKAFELIKNTN